MVPMHVLVVGPDQLHHVVRPPVLLVINSPAVIDLIQWISCLNLIKAQSRAQNQKKPPSLWFVDSFCALNSVRKCGSKDHTVLVFCQNGKNMNWQLLKHQQMQKLHCDLKIKPKPTSILAGLGIRSFQKNAPFFAFFSVLLKRTERSLRSFPFF